MVFDYCHETQFTLLLIFSRTHDPVLSRFHSQQKRRWRTKYRTFKKAFLFSPFPFFRKFFRTTQHNPPADDRGTHFLAPSTGCFNAGQVQIICCYYLHLSARRRRDFFFFLFFLPSGKIRINDNKNECKKFRLCYGQVQTAVSPE